MDFIGFPNYGISIGDRDFWSKTALVLPERRSEMNSMLHQRAEEL